ncbi:MAG TPA: molecular chaperone DnaK, partial [Solibacterales bacterium]|nr:molecular chaperone DnaK [Bryobacterales bacterium]
ANGILHVTAKDRATSNEQKITITSSSGLSKDEVEKMARDAESHSADDKRRKDEVDARNRADSMVYQVEKMLKDHGSRIGEADKKSVEVALEDTKKAIADNAGVERINAAVDQLTAASHKLAEAMYRSTADQQPGGTPGDAGAGAGSPGGGGAKQAPKDNVVDAEFVDVDDKK